MVFSGSGGDFMLVRDLLILEGAGRRGKLAKTVLIIWSILIRERQFSTCMEAQLNKFFVQKQLLKCCPLQLFLWRGIIRSNIVLHKPSFLNV